MDQWLTILFPGVTLVGIGSDEGGNQSILIDKDGKHYLIVTAGYDYGSWVEESYELTEEETLRIISWEAEHLNEGVYLHTINMLEWLRNKRKKGGT